MNDKTATLIIKINGSKNYCTLTSASKILIEHSEAHTSIEVTNQRSKAVPSAGLFSSTFHITAIHYVECSVSIE